MLREYHSRKNQRFLTGHWNTTILDYKKYLGPQPFCFKENMLPQLQPNQLTHCFWAMPVSLGHTKESTEGTPRYAYRHLSKAAYAEGTQTSISPNKCWENGVCCLSPRFEAPQSKVHIFLFYIFLYRTQHDVFQGKYFLRFFLILGSFSFISIFHICLYCLHFFYLFLKTFSLSIFFVFISIFQFNSIITPADTHSLTVANLTEEAMHKMMASSCCLRSNSK